MTQEEKELLIKDLCARLPYKPRVKYHYRSIGSAAINGYSDEGYLSYQNLEDFSIYPKYGLEKTRVCNILPYLRSLSSMTEEEKKELSKKYVWNIWTGQIQIRYHSQGCWDDETECPTEEYIILFDWLNKHHFDYRGLIEKRLALEAEEGMYNI